jgi:hypothetical protein
MSLSFLSREDLTAMIMTHDDIVLVYAVDGTDDTTVGTADQIEGILEENAKKLYEDSAYISFDEKYHPISLDEAKDKVWDCANVCTKEDYDREQTEIEEEQE